MSKRSRVGLVEVADWPNLAAAFGRAAKGAGDRQAAECYRARLETELACLGREIRSEVVRVGQMTGFCIRDPKPRVIHAPCFRERVLHHALMAHVGPVLDRALVDDTFACRKGRGALAAVRRCQHHQRRYPWYVQIDIRAYFACIDHQVLLRLLARKFKNAGLLRLMERIIVSFHAAPGKGLPIGALTSQHFANFYLSGLDRWLLETVRIRGMVRYMDDSVWWCDDRKQARETLRQAQEWMSEQLKVEIKQPARIGRSRDGLLFCGYRALPGALLLSRRRKRRYAQRRRYWESQYELGRIDAAALQAGFAAALAITAHTDAAAWRREQLRRRPLAPALETI